MSGSFLERARQFAARYSVRLGEELGAGTQGVVFRAIDNVEGEWAAVKTHFSEPSFRAESEVHRCLDELRVSEVAGFAVPRLVRLDESLLAIEMSIVSPPYVLDFGGAEIGDDPPEFPEDTLALWEQERREQFGDCWPVVRHVIAEFQKLGIHLLDVSPGNIAFRG